MTGERAPMGSRFRDGPPLRGQYGFQRTNRRGKSTEATTPAKTSNSRDAPQSSSQPQLRDLRGSQAQRGSCSQGARMSLQLGGSGVWGSASATTARPAPQTAVLQSPFLRPTFALLSHSGNRARECMSTVNKWFLVHSWLCCSYLVPVLCFFFSFSRRSFLFPSVLFPSRSLFPSST